MKIDKKLLGDYNFGEVQKINEKIFERDAFYYGDLKQIAKMFLGETLSINVWQSGFQEIREATITESNSPDLPNTEKEFYSKICDTYLWVQDEPRVHFVKAYSNAQKHLEEIDLRIGRIQDELFKIEKQKIAKTYKTSEVDRQSLLNFYLLRNTEAKNEITEFLRKGLKHFARNKAMAKIGGFNLMFEIPYNYALRNASLAFEPKNPTDIDNKFLDEQLERIEEIKRIYKEDTKEFDRFLKDYIEREAIVYMINETINSHHLLVERADYLSELLSQYENGNYTVFLNAAVTQIEGIITDACILYENDKKRKKELEYEISNKGLGWKLDNLSGKLGWEIHYQYYYFRFRVLRNRIAHGRLTKHDREQIAGIVLLDIYDVCKIMGTIKILLNRKVITIKILTDQIKFKRFNYWFFLTYLLLNDIEVPGFYNMGEQIEKIELLKEHDDFWNYLSAERTIKDENMKAAIYQVAIHLRKDLALKTRAEALLKQLSYKPESGFDRHSFLDRST